MEIIKNFGLNPVLLVAQIINFLIVLFILKKLLYKPVLDMLKKRQGVIKEGLKQAEEARLKLERVVIEEKNILRQAQLQSKKIIEDAKQESLEIARKINDDTKKQTEKLLIDTREQIERETAEVEKKLALNTTEIAKSVLEKTLEDFFSTKEKNQVIEKVLRKIKKGN